MDAASNGSNSIEAISRGSMSLDMAASGFDIVQNSTSWFHLHNILTSNSPAKVAGTSTEVAMSLDAHVTKPMGIRDNATTTNPSAETNKDRPSLISIADNFPKESASPLKSSSVQPSDHGTIYQWPTPEERSPSSSLPRRPVNVVYSPAKTKQSKKQQHTRQGNIFYFVFSCHINSFIAFMVWAFHFFNLPSILLHFSVLFLHFALSLPSFVPSPFLHYFTLQGSQVSRTESIRSKTSQKSFSEFIFIPQYLSLVCFSS